MRAFIFRKRGNTIWDVIDVISFADSAKNMYEYLSWKNAGWLALDTIGLLPVIPRQEEVANRQEEASNQIREVAKRQEELTKQQEETDKEIRLLSGENDRGFKNLRELFTGCTKTVSGKRQPNHHIMITSPPSLSLSTRPLASPPA
jgi:hypothetical protein